MTDTAFDRPDVIIFPPVIPLTTLAIACLLQWLEPLGWIAQHRAAVRIGIGADHCARGTGRRRRPADAR